MELAAKFLLTFTSPHTRRNYGADLNDFFEYSGKTIQDAELFDLISFRDNLINKDLAPATINRKLASVRSFSKWCIERGALKLDFTQGVRSLKNAQRYPTRAFMDDEVACVLNAPKPTRHNLILEFLFKIGLRRSELVNLRVRDVRKVGNDLILSIKGKGGKIREVPLSDKLTKFLISYINQRKLGRDDFLVQSKDDFKNTKSMDSGHVSRLVKKYALKSGVDKRVSAHSCRATVISHLLELGESPRNVAYFAGHSNINTTISVYDKKRDSFKNSPAHKVNYREVSNDFLIREIKYVK